VAAVALEANRMEAAAIRAAVDIGMGFLSGR